MRYNGRLGAALLGAGIMLLCGATLQAEEQQQERVNAFTMHCETIETFRETGMNAISNLVHFFDAGAKLEWQTKICSEFSDEQLSDFFTGALVFIGAYTEAGAVVGLYNPWWDAILMIQTKGSLPKKMTDKIVVPVVTRFVLMSGESFRKENPPKISFTTVVPGSKDPISAEIWQVQTRTLKRFNEIFSLERETDISFRASALGLAKIVEKTELERIQLRSALRLKFYLMLMKNPTDLAIARRITAVLREATETKIKSHFQDPYHKFFAEELAKLPYELRSGFSPYGYVPTEAGSLMVFVNKDMPRLYATVSFPKGRVKDTSKGHVIMEWYDLDQAESLLQAWNEESKGGVK